MGKAAMPKFEGRVMLNLFKDKPGSDSEYQELSVVNGVRQGPLTALSDIPTPTTIRSTASRCIS